MEYKQNNDIKAAKKLKAEKARRRRRRRAARIFAAFIAVLISVAVILSLTVFFPVTEIKAEGSKIYTPSQIIAASGITVGENVFMSGSISADSKITKALPYIKTASIKRSFTGEVSITVTDTAAQYCYLADGEYYICDKDNKILEITSSPMSEIVEIRLSDKVTGEKGEYMNFSSADDRFLADKIYSSFNSFGITADIIDISDDLNIKVLAEKRLVLLFGTKNEFDGKMAHFQGMYRKMSPDVSGIVTLSAWSTTKQEAYFKEFNIEGYFDLNKPADTDDAPDSGTKNENAVDDSSKSDSSDLESIKSGSDVDNSTSESKSSGLSEKNSN